MSILNPVNCVCLIAAEHFVFLHDIICVQLSLVFASMLIHGYLPAPFMQSAVTIVPILKNRQGGTSDDNDYRIIAIITALVKVLNCIL